MADAGVQIHLFAAARAAVGTSVVTTNPGSLRVMLDEIERAHPDFASVRVRCSYLIDGVSTHGEDVDVTSGSRVDVLPPFAGG